MLVNIRYHSMVKPLPSYVFCDFHIRTTFAVQGLFFQNSGFFSFDFFLGLMY